MLCHLEYIVRKKNIKFILEYIEYNTIICVRKSRNIDFFPKI